MEFEEERIRDWLVPPPKFCTSQSYCRKFKTYADNLVATNDHTERAVGMMQRFVHNYSYEEEIQERLMAVDATRYAMKEKGRRSNKLSEKQMVKALTDLKEKT